MMRELWAPLPHGGGLNEPKMIVVHAMAEHIYLKSYPGFEDGVYGAWDFLRQARLSAHTLAYPRGELVNMRNPNTTAWHAKDFNQDSLGIEILLPGIHDYGSFLAGIALDGWVPAPAWNASVYKVKRWLDVYPDCEIVMHHMIDPHRKQDPGAGFHWTDFLDEVMR